MTQVPRLLTASQAAEILEIHAETVRTWARQGKINVIRYPSGGMRFRREEIEAIERGEYQPEAIETTAPAGAA